MSVSTILKRLQHLELEEQILNLAAIVALAGVFFPWMGGQLLGSDNVTYSGFGFYTSFLGIAVFLLHLFILLMTVSPIAGGPVLVRKKYREELRLFLSAQSVVLVLASLSVLMQVTFQFSRMEVRFGIYVSLIGSLVVLLYSFLRVQERKKSDAEAFFAHPNTSEDVHSENSTQPPPPPPSAPENHHFHGQR